jgi:hypothetical protein
MLTVPAVVPAVKVSVLLEPLSVPRLVLERAQAYDMPEVGQVDVHTGVAVKVVWLPEATEGVVGDNVTEVRELASPETVITVLVPTVVVPSVALTKIPTVPEVVPAVKVTEVPLPLSEPSAMLVRAHV